MNVIVPGSAGAAYSGPSHPASPGVSFAVYFQMTASTMMTVTTTRLITVSWNIAYGKNGLPRSLTSCL